MVSDKAERVLRTVRRHLTAISLLRTAAILAFLAVFAWSVLLPPLPGRRLLYTLFIGAVLAWFILLLGAVRVARQVQSGSILLASGQLDRAEQWLSAIIQRFSLSPQAKLVACQQLASVSARRGEYADAVAMCREVLRHRLAAGVRGLVIGTRLLLSDVLLTLGDVAGAYDTLRPVYDQSLSLSERMRLLPVQLRYELIADHAASAVQGLRDKVRLAELLDPPGAALVHALLAEACRREQLPAESSFLAERARLYHDLAPLAERYPVIRPVLDTV